MIAPAGRAALTLVGVRLEAVIASAATSKTLGLIATFGGIGVLVNVIIAYILVQVRGEKQANEEYVNLGSDARG